MQLKILLINKKKKKWVKYSIIVCRLCVHNFKASLCYRFQKLSFDKNKYKVWETLVIINLIIPVRGTENSFWALGGFAI